MLKFTLSKVFVALLAGCLATPAIARDNGGQGGAGNGSDGYLEIQRENESKANKKRRDELKAFSPVTRYVPPRRYRRGTSDGCNWHIDVTTGSRICKQ